MISNTAPKNFGVIMKDNKTTLVITAYMYFVLASAIALAAIYYDVVGFVKYLVERMGL